MDLAATARARATRMSLLWAGWSSWRTWAGAYPRYGTDDNATAGGGPTRKSEARDSELQQASRRGMRMVTASIHSCSFLEQPAV